MKKGGQHGQMKLHIKEIMNHLGVDEYTIGPHPNPQNDKLIEEKRSVFIQSSHLTPYFVGNGTLLW